MRLLVMLLLPAIAWAQVPAECAGDATLSGRTDVVLCEGFESANWWQNGYFEDGGKTDPLPAQGPDSTQVVTTDCIAGSCLQGNFPPCSVGSSSGVISHHKPIPGHLQKVYLRYYLKLGSNFGQPYFLTTSGCTVGAGGNTPAGKFPGLADVRTNEDGEQCGNGGAFSDGINCWSARAAFRNCTAGTSLDAPVGTDICTQDIDVDGNQSVEEAVIRYGFYWYLPNATGTASPNNSQIFGLWDTWRTGTSSAGSGGCTADPFHLGNDPNTVPCGKTTGGNGGLVPNMWYRMEWYLEMNTPGQSNGVARGWLNGVLKYEKTNMVFRRPGHDDLHFRTLWLELHGGGEFMGQLDATNVWLDQFVVIDASGWGGDMNMRPGCPSACGKFRADTASYTPEFSVTVVQPSPDAPAYVTSMAQNEIKALTSVSNGNATYAAVPGLAWRSNPGLSPAGVDCPGGGGPQASHIQKVYSFSGGIGNPGDRVAYAHGGGHAASAYNGLIGFDFKGTTQPTGFFLVPGTESPNPADAAVVPPSDGRPISIHSYDDLIFDEVNNRFWRLAGSSFCGNGSKDLKDWYTPSSGGAGNPWVGFTRPFSISLIGHGKTAYNKATNKALYVTSNRTRFLNLSTQTWSSTDGPIFPNTTFHMTMVFVPDAPDSVSGTVFVFGAGRQQKAAVNFQTETVGAWTSVGVTGDSTFVADEMLSMFWDETLGIIWIFGGRVDGSDGLFSDYYRFNPGTNVSVKATMTGTMPNADAGFGVNINNIYGLNKRFVYIKEWRAVGMITNHLRPAYIWKLPSS